ncbi:uncharacterized protein LOC127594799 [Hippocampus zosterae]|uniref:uncharacterized protein LOC127594799 n=1 Tax=Hippocampus zosterae TaxID=109293 RepID=UPI00223D91AB|nr:uncharacterized protein LOC127594799 [Hippocampus zosterae]
MDFSQLIFGAVLQPEPALQKQAEAQLMGLLNDNPTAFLAQMAKMLAEDRFDSSMRQAAGTILKRSLRLPEKHWSRVPPDNRNEIKDLLLGNLVTSDKLAKRASADCISCVLALELPGNEWPTLIPVLANNTVHENVEIRQASIMTLGFVCEQVRETGAPMQRAEQETILAGIFKGITKQNPPEIQHTSLKALRDSVAFMQELFRMPGIKNLTFNTINELIMRESDQESKELCFQVLFELAKHCYTALEEDVDTITQLTAPFMTDGGSCSRLRKAAIEVWAVLAGEYKELKEAGTPAVNYAAKHETEMVQVMLKNLLFYEDEDEDMNGISDSAEQALCSIGEHCSEAAVGIVVNFISHTLNSDNPKMRRAGLLAFITVLDNAHKAHLQKLCMSGLGEFVARLQDGTVFVREAAAKTISKVAENFPECFFGRMEHYDEFDQVLFSLKDEVRVMRHTCWTLCYLAEAAQKQPCARFKDRTKRMIDLLLENAARGEEDEKERLIIDVCFMAIFNLVSTMASAPLSAEYAFFILGQLKSVVSKPINAKQEAYLFGMLTFLHCCLMQIQVDSVFVCPPELVSAAYATVMRLFQVLQDVSPEGMYVVSSVAAILKSDFLKLLNEFWPYVEHALARGNDLELVKGALGFVGDACRAVGATFESKLPPLLKLMNNFICNVEFDREGKITVFLTMADLVMNLGECLLPHITQFFQTFNLGISACLDFTIKKQEQDYVNTLKDVILESEMCVFHGLRKTTAAQNDAFVKHLHYVIDFLKFAGPACRGSLTSQEVKSMQAFLTKLKPDKDSQDCHNYVNRYIFHLP